MGTEQQNETHKFFDSIAKVWQQKATSNTYNIIENRHAAVLEIMSRFQGKPAILDVGCGTGQLAIEASQLEWNATGVVWGLGEQLRPLIGRVVDKPNGYSSSYGWTPQHVVALRWLKRKTTVSDVFITNRFCRINEYPPLCDSDSLVV